MKLYCPPTRADQFIATNKIFIYVGADGQDCRNDGQDRDGKDGFFANPKLSRLRRLHHEVDRLLLLLLMKMLYLLLGLRDATRCSTWYKIIGLCFS